MIDQDQVCSLDKRHRWYTDPTLELLKEISNGHFCTFDSARNGKVTVAPDNNHRVPLLLSVVQSLLRLDTDLLRLIWVPGRPDAMAVPFTPVGRKLAPVRLLDCRAYISGQAAIGRDRQRQGGQDVRLGSGVLLPGAGGCSGYRMVGCGRKAFRRRFALQMVSAHHPLLPSPRNSSATAPAR